jgi:hypothetical protein
MLLKTITKNKKEMGDYQILLYFAYNTMPTNNIATHETEPTAKSISMVGLAIDAPLMNTKATIKEEKRSLRCSPKTNRFWVIAWIETKPKN